MKKINKKLLLSSLGLVATSALIASIAASCSQTQDKKIDLSKIKSEVKVEYKGAKDVTFESVTEDKLVAGNFTFTAPETVNVTFKSAVKDEQKTKITVIYTLVDKNNEKNSKDFEIVIAKSEFKADDNQVDLSKIKSEVKVEYKGAKDVTFESVTEDKLVAGNFTFTAPETVNVTFKSAVKDEQKTKITVIYTLVDKNNEKNTKDFEIVIAKSEFKADDKEKQLNINPDNVFNNSLYFIQKTFNVNEQTKNTKEVIFMDFAPNNGGPKASDDFIGQKSYLITENKKLQGIITFREYVNGLEPNTYDVEVIDAIHNKLTITTYKQDGTVLMNHPEITDLTTFPISGAPLLMKFIHTWQTYRYSLSKEKNLDSVWKTILEKWSTAPLLVKDKETYTFSDSTQSLPTEWNISNHQTNVELYQEKAKRDNIFNPNIYASPYANTITENVIKAVSKTTGKDQTGDQAGK
ncbi:Vmc-like lipoprotein signal peptide domain-containing protein [Ureaplasma zalophigenitalium]|uniref:Lipoprotein-associated type-17 domain-containing protein n=1 Tax=Ureaplasma zalophigenitalium TaxID=907723 RepID=A0ABT3BQ17_9BACT|nr:hypothetical protein [Ureaplasma zalophigenitalium]MCV3754327.1 hypothetical protein [Ureaplasma zalophigenitalium]